MRRLRQQPSPEGELDMSPMIDIVFNLLIFFLCATKFRTAEGAIKAYLPTDQGDGTSPALVEINDVRITIRPEGPGVRVRVGQVVLTQAGDFATGRDPARSPLWPRLHAKLVELKAAHAGAKPLPVVLDVRPQVHHQYAISTLNEVVRAGLEEVTFARPEASD